MGPASTFEIDEDFVQGRIPPRRRDSHKGMNGVVCIVGGSRTYHGAPFLCAMGAARTGVDLVYLAVPSDGRHAGQVALARPHSHPAPRQQAHPGQRVDGSRAGSPTSAASG